MFAVCVCVASYNSSSMIQTFKTFGYLPINNQTVAKMAPQYTITYYNIGYEFYGVVSDAEVDIRFSSLAKSRACPCLNDLFISSF